ncbi:MAG TPA: PQQ-dependent sugar dehydrogenase [Nitrososphaeraceae archaeon]
MERKLAKKRGKLVASWSRVYILLNYYASLDLNKRTSLPKSNLLNTLVMTVFISLLQGALIQNTFAQPQISDPQLRVDIVAKGLISPTTMAFLNGTDILVLEKDGNVRRVTDGILQEKPVLHVKVQTESERGLLGIAANDKDVFLYLTEPLASGDSVKNRIYKYHWNGAELTDPSMILDLPGLPGPNHDGGKLLIGPSPNETGRYLYAVIGDLNHDGKLQNFKDGPEPDNTSVIFRVNPNDGSAPKGNPFSNDNATSRYWAYGIRNTFGLAIDPITHILWATENGPDQYDEINIVKPGFNSGWQAVMGPISREGKTESDLVKLPGSHYSDPLLSWKAPPALTGIEFLNSSKLGAKYTNNIFVGDYNGGNLYFFQINDRRNDLKLDKFGSALSDRVVDNNQEFAPIIFGTGFGGITDIQSGPDGFLYILSIGDGAIYKIMPV